MMIHEAPIFSVVKKSKQMCNLLYALSRLNNNILISLYKVYFRSFLDNVSILFIHLIISIYLIH